MQDDGHIYICINLSCLLQLLNSTMAHPWLIWSGTRWAKSGEKKVFGGDGCAALAGIAVHVWNIVLASEVRHTEILHGIRICRVTEEHSTRQQQQQCAQKSRNFETHTQSSCRLSQECHVWLNDRMNECRLGDSIQKCNATKRTPIQAKS